MNVILSKYLQLFLVVNENLTSLEDLLGLTD